MPMRLNGMRARSWAPCTMKRPAMTGANPARLSRTQSLAATRSKRSALAAASPAAAAVSGAYYFFIGCGTKIHRHPPAAGADIHKGHGNVVGRKSLGGKIGEPARRLFIGFEYANDRRFTARRLIRTHCSVGSFQSFARISQGPSTGKSPRCSVQIFHREIHFYPHGYAEPFPGLFHRTRGRPFRSFLPGKCHMKWEPWKGEDRAG